MTSTVPARSSGSLVQTALDRSTGPLDVVLVSDDQAVVILPAEGDDLLTFVPDDDLDVVGTAATGRADRVAEQGAPTDPVQHLGVLDLIRVPSPAARMTTGHGASGRHGRGLPGAGRVCGWAGPWYSPDG